MFLAAYAMDLINLDILLKEFKDKQRLIPELEAQLHSTSSYTDSRYFSPNATRLKIEKIKAVAPDLTARDAHGRHIAHFAAMGGNCDTLAFILEAPGVIESLTEEDKKTIMECAVGSSSVQCIRYVMGTFAIAPDPYWKVGKYFGILSLREMSDIGRTPLLTRAAIEAKFASANDAELYKFICQYTHAGKCEHYNILISYYYLGGKPEQCKAMLERVRALELSPLMQDPNYDIDNMIRVQKEFSSLAWDLSGFRKLNLNQIPHFYHMKPDDINKSYELAIQNGNVAECHSLRRRYPIQMSMDGAIRMAIRLGQKNIIEYFVRNADSFSSYFRSSGASLLWEAVENKQLAITRYLIEEFNAPIPINELGLLRVAASNPENRDVIGYLFNRADFLVQDKTTLEWDLKLSDQAKLQIASLVFSEDGVRKLFAKPAQELYGYLLFLSKLRWGTDLTTLLPDKLSRDLRLQVLSQLLALEREAIQRNECPGFLIYPQKEYADKLSATELAAYHAELEKHFAECVAIIENPFKSEEQRADAEEQV